MLSSALFANADQSRALLKFVVEEAVQNRTERLKEYTVGAEALGRGESFDPRTDTVVRAEASRLRSRLERYYAGEGKTDPVQISLPKGSYIPLFTPRESPEATSDSTAAVDRWQTGFGDPGRRAWLAAASSAVALAAGVWALWPSRSDRTGKTAPPVVQFAVSPPPGSIFEAPIGRQSLAISPDGTRLAFVVTDAGGSRVWVRDLAALDLTPVPGTEGARTVFWAPDSRSLFYSVKRQFKQANLVTGLVAFLGPAALFGHVRLVAFEGRADPLSRTPLILRTPDAVRQSARVAGHEHALGRVSPGQASTSSMSSSIPGWDDIARW